MLNQNNIWEYHFEIVLDIVLPTLVDLGWSYKDFSVTINVDAKKKEVNFT